ncbi:Shikimate dehydrogenase (NADP(+)) [Buchnera aphidicola (Thelaxes suberi)]|uniref:shikimate dehydrogenase n=1 Tax=Buchnera aphidicola TaxID=9 RepID=UPI003464DC5D
MVNIKKKCFAVFGNPIIHSLSPLIHNYFSYYTKIDYEYISVLVPLDDFNKILYDFFTNRYGIGANITAPYKEKAFLFANKLTDKAFIAGSVNTLFKINNDIILGDNTDGIGLLYDLKRLKFLIKKNNVLILGAGGAAKGIIPSLIKYGCNIFLHNRTKEKVDNLIKQFKILGNVHNFTYFNNKKIHFDLIINTTSCIFSKDVKYISQQFFSKTTFFYDICYDLKKDTSFLSWCKTNGAIYYSDGFGMLVCQAAYSFSIWNKDYLFIENMIDATLTYFKKNKKLIFSK